MKIPGLILILSGNIEIIQAQFSGPYFLPPAPGLNSLVVTDFDGFEGPDLVVGRTAPVASVGWYGNNGIGQFGSFQTISADLEVYDQVLTGDLDQDNDEDLILRKGNLILWRANNGAENFGDTIEIGTASLLYQAIDLTGDGYPEIVATNGTEPFWLYNDGSGKFTALIYFPLQYNDDYKPYFADMNNDDDDPDVLSLSEQSGTIFWYENTGFGFGTENYIGYGADYDFAGIFPADLDNDGDQDVLVPSWNVIWWFANLGGGVFDHNPQQIESNVPFYRSLATVADFDRDGDNDVFAALIGNPDINEGGHFRYYENTGNGTFAAPDSFGLAAGCRKLLVEDLDRDGDLDVVFNTDSAIGWWENLLNPAIISGGCFWDKNENKQWDAGEPAVNGIHLQLQPVSLVTYTDPDGKFSFFTTPGEYVLSYAPNGCWELTTDSSEYHLNSTGLPLTGYLFGFKRSNGDRAVQPVVGGSHARCSEDVPFWITLDNNRSCNEASGKVALVLDDLVDYSVSGTPPTFISGDTLWWDFDTIAPSGHAQINLLLHVAGADHTGDTIHLQAFTWLDEPDGSYTYSASYSYRTVILCSYDPNDKLADRPTVPKDYSPEDYELIYTIRFQNTGNDTAFLVRLRDTLSPQLDWTTLRPLGSSHPFYPVFNTQTGLLQFMFEDILLPDSATNPAGSQGFVQFAIRLQPGLLPGTLVPNRAGIYFDANPVVLTNTAETRVLTTVTVLTPVAPPSLLVQPNPTTGICTLRLQQAAPEGAMLELMDAQGRLLFSQVVPTGVMEQSMDLGTFPAGVYLVKLNQTGLSSATTKIVRQ